MCEAEVVGDEAIDAELGEFVIGYHNCHYIDL